MRPGEFRVSAITGGKLNRVPNQPKTPLHAFRIPDELYHAARLLARERGETVAKVVRRALENYVKQPPPPPTPLPPLRPQRRKPRI